MDVQESERFRLGALLAVTGGIFDAYTYLCRGRVFANAQTGNIVLIGIRAVDKDSAGVLSAVIPVLAFAMGVFVIEFMKRKFKTEETHKYHWRHIVVAIEIVLVAGISFIPQGSMNHFVNVVVSFVCAMQVQTFRKVRGYTFASTMCTGNLRSGTEALNNYICTGDKKERHRCICTYGIICCFIFGALIGALCSTYIPYLTLPLCVVIYIIVFVFMIEWHV